MDTFDGLESSEYVVDSDDQDSLDERIDNEQRLRNQQLWASFQNAACCITKLYKDRSQSAVSLWNPFQNAASNLTTLYKDCIDSQRRFAKIGYQVGRKRRLREFKKLLKKHQSQNRQQHQSHRVADIGDRYFSGTPTTSDDPTQATSEHLQSQSNVASILAVNQLNLDCDDSPPSQSMQMHLCSNQQSITETAKQSLQPNHHHDQTYDQQPQSQQLRGQSNINSSQAQLLCNNEDDLVTFQQALVQPTIVKSSIKSGQHKRPSLRTSGYLQSPAVDHAKSEEDRLLELNEFLAEEYHRHVGSKKRPCPSGDSNFIKRARESS